MLQKVAPLLPAISISETDYFFRNKLKFTTINLGNYLIAKKDKVEIHFYLWPGKGTFTTASCYIFANNIEDLYARFSTMDVMNPKSNLRDNAFGKKEFHLLDNNGNKLVFGGM